MAELVKKQVCKCENCGNEAEMVVTCSLPDTEAVDGGESGSDPGQEKGSDTHVLGTATCTNCGNEADMWIDI